MIKAAAIALIVCILVSFGTGRIKICGVGLTSLLLRYAHKGNAPIASLIKVIPRNIAGMPSAVF